MSPDQARSWIIKMSLAATGATFVFLIIGPVAGYPLSYDQVPRMLEIILPVFLGYVGTATHFFFHTQGAANPPVVPQTLLALLIKGPVYVFALGTIVLFVAFGLANRQLAPDGSGMSIDQLSGFLTALFGLLAVSTSVAVSYLFALKKK